MTAAFFNRVRRVRSRWGWKKPILVIFVVVVLAGVGVWQKGGQKEAEKAEKVLPKVEVRRLDELSEEKVVEKMATVEPAEWAPLVARSGGRVTAVRVPLGQKAGVGQVVVEVDGAGIASPARVQVATAAESLRAFEDIRKQALKSVDNAVAIAELNLEASVAGRSLSVATVLKSREVADNAVLQAEFAWQDALDGGNNLLIRTTDLALKAARLAQDQATLARDTASRQSTDAVKQAQQALIGARIARDKLVADLNGQRVGLDSQMAAARELVKLAQIIAPLSGQVTSLNVGVGDFVRPGQQVGEIMASAGSAVTVDVTEGTRERLVVSQRVVLELDGTDLEGEIVRLADAPSVGTSLWQVDIVVVGDDVVQPGKLVKVELPVEAVSDRGIFIPLDVITVRQDGIVVFTVDDEGVVQKHVVRVIGYTGDFVEGAVDLPGDALVVVNGNRILRAGQKVEVAGS